ncbi:MAG: septum formation protein Maf [Candidatus Omnitrophica bacterium]|nr:septum formation protein Maf [Candidatus Omnitrophota bacterium]
MKKIILASASPQRKNLMKLLKVPFTVRRSTAQEKDTITTTVSDLVKDNALLKAIDIAEQMKEPAIVIGADTVVYAKSRLVIKPKDLKEAKKNLKMLMSEPHWVYTGLAVIDTEDKTVLVDHDKTKVFMNQMTDEEIDRYHQHVSPLDKAGGFDIEGRGGVFIPRIEGCYFNVVGLPVAKLAQMLKKFGVHVLMLVMMISVYGCGGISSNFNTATGNQETTMYSTEREQELGASVSAGMEKELKVLDDVALNERVDRITQKIAQVCDRQELVYIAKVVEEKKPQDNGPTVNAFSLPGGYVYVYKGLLDYIKDDDELAAVIAHEVAHVTARHSIKRLQASYGSLVAVLAAMTTNGALAGGISMATESMFFDYSQQDELQADALGVKYMTAAGYDPQGMIRMLEALQKYDEKQPIRPKMYARDHPYVHQRLAAANQAIKQDLTFRDYVRSTGEQLGKDK